VSWHLRETETAWKMEDIYKTTVVVAWMAKIRVYVITVQNS